MSPHQVVIAREAKNLPPSNIWSDHSTLIADSAIFPRDVKQPEQTFFSRFSGAVDKVFHRNKPVADDIRSAKAFETGAADYVAPPMAD